MASVLLHHFYALILLLLPISCGAQSYTNVSLGSSLTASDDSASPSWVSPSGDFALGFRKIENQGFLLAIWFNKIPERTIVWSANRNKYVQRGSKVELTADGDFILSDSTGKQTRIADRGGTAVAYAAMLDTGNFILASRDSATLWESFDNPTDTILPTQIMNLEIKLYAPISDTNFSTGRFMLYLQNDGNLQLLTTSFPLDTPNFAYWSTSTAGSGFQLIFNQSAFIYVVAKNQSIVNMVSSDVASTQDFYQRAAVDSDGIFRRYIYPKSTAASGGKWPMRWSTLFYTPSNICLAIREDTGSGACGLNSYCSLGEDSGKICQCPYGYTFVDPNDVMKGCQKN